MKNKLAWIILLFTILFTACNTTNKEGIPFNSDKIYYQGRIDFNSDTAATFYWSGTSATIRFKGSEVFATLADERGINFYNIIIDGKFDHILNLDKEKQEYQLAGGVSDSIHELQIFRRAQYTEGKTWFYGFRTGENTQILDAPPTPERKIIVYGNSITAGHGIDDPTGRDRSDSTFTNNYKSYAAITARNLNAQYSCICRSGIGIMISWFPEIMPEVYNRLDPTDENNLWDFQNYQPDVVVVNLFQNDSWLVNHTRHAEFKHRFGDTPPTEDFIVASYKNFISKLRDAYPNANIICALGNMDATREGSEWPGYIQEAVDQMNDPKIDTHFMPFKKTGRHPSAEEQMTMANSLTQKINDVMKW